MLMGYDVDPREEGGVIADYLAARDELLAAGEEVVPDEIALLGLIADFAELIRNRPAGEDLHTELRVHSSREHFHAFLQSLDVERGGLPDQFRDRLARVLAHYGVTDWDRTPQLEEAVFRIFLAQQRSPPTYSSPPRSSSAGSPSLRLRKSWPARPGTFWSAWSGPPSCGSPSSATWPGALGSAGSTSPSWMPTGERPGRSP